MFIFKNVLLKLIEKITMKYKEKMGLLKFKNGFFSHRCRFCSWDARFFILTIVIILHILFTDCFFFLCFSFSFSSCDLFLVNARSYVKIYQNGHPCMLSCFFFSSDCVVDSLVKHNVLCSTCKS